MYIERSRIGGKKKKKKRQFKTFVEKYFIMLPFDTCVHTPHPQAGVADLHTGRSRSCRQTRPLGKARGSVLPAD